MTGTVAFGPYQQDTGPPAWGSRLPRSPYVGSVQPAAQQVRVFQEAIGLTGLAVTKMDGSARAGVVLSIEAELKVPVKLVGIGEGLDDLNRFDPDQYLNALLRMEEVA